MTYIDVWGSERFNCLTFYEKSLYVYFTTNSSVKKSGCYRIIVKKCCDELDISEFGMHKQIKRLCDYGVIDYDEDTKELFIVNFPERDMNACYKIVSSRLKERALNENSIIKIEEKKEIAVLNEKEKAINKAVSEIIDFLNMKCGTRYRKSGASKKCITARLNDGYTVDEFKVVIIKKYEDWNGTEFEKYMRPQTLFGTKFDEYLNQPYKKKKENMFIMTDEELDLFAKGEF